MVRRSRPAWLAVLVALTAAGCSAGHSTSSSNSTSPPPPQRGQLLSPAAKVASYGTSDLLTLLGLDPLGQLLLTLHISPGCTVTVYHIEYETVGGRSEATTASGALMVPSGSHSFCQGPRPIVEYAHGTSADKSYDITKLTGSSEGLILAAVFASEGYIVVAPNYAGYDTSTLGYHPYLVGAQQADDMIDALAAARSALPVADAPGVTDDHKLYITGYSQGGYVAMATHRALQAAGQTVTASAPMSGPYTLGAFGDALFLGQVNGSATVNFAILANAYQNAYGNLYSDPSEVFATPYASSVPGLLPSATALSMLYSENLLPQNALFSSTPPAPQYASITPATMPANLAVVFALGFGSNFLLSNAYRLSYLQDQQANPDGGLPTVTDGLPAASPGNALRQDLRQNDLRAWSPSAPVLLCGGDEDPVVFFFNTQLMQSYWTSHPPPGTVSVLDVDSAATANDPYADEKTGFAAARAAVEASAIAGGATDGGHAAVLESYHAPLVPPFCLAAAKVFFDSH